MPVSISWDFPMSLHLGPVVLTLHGLVEAAGIFIAFRFYLWQRRLRGDDISTENRIWIVIAATLGAVLGSRVLGAAENIPEWLTAPDKLAYVWGNKTLVGGLLGGLFAVELAKKLVGEQRRSGDAFVFPLVLGMMLGRLACFSAGVYEETYGLPSSLPWAMNLGDGIPRHPVTLYEIAFLALLWMALARLRGSQQLAPGALFKIFLMSYLLFRFLLDFIKPGWRYFFGLGSIQLSCMAGLIYYYRYLLRPRLLRASMTPQHAG
jgi:prolipoprotein diacylglyceryltransferase